MYSMYRFFEKIYNKKFAKCKPLWLKNQRGSQLELDGYNDELKIAFEYQGRQHYEDNNWMKSENRYGLKRLRNLYSIKLTALYW